MNEKTFLLIITLTIGLGFFVGWNYEQSITKEKEYTQCVPENCDSEGRCTWYPVI